MLYYLALLKDSCGPLRLFDYVTFRAGGAAATAFFIVLLFGAPLPGCFATSISAPPTATKV